MKKLVGLIVFSLMLALTSTSALAQISYCKDFLEAGNPGGWNGTSLKTFEDEWTLSPGETVAMDIWLNDLPEELVSGGFFIAFDPDLVNVTEVLLYDTDHGGPWDPEATRSFAVGPGEWFLALAQFACITPDGDGDIPLAKVTFECQGSGDVTVTINTIPDFYTVVGCDAGTPYDDQISPNVVTLHQEHDNSCEGRLSCDYDPAQACQCDPACEQWGDCCPDKCDFCPCDGSCEVFSCDVYVPAQSCQCDPACEQWGDCCPDKCDFCPASCEGSCEGYCGGQSAGECWCDPACASYEDCCPDYDQFCAVPPDSCQGRCGEQAPAGCYCNAACVGYGDCCPDYDQFCGS